MQFFILLLLISLIAISGARTGEVLKEVIPTELTVSFAQSEQLLTDDSPISCAAAALASSPQQPSLAPVAMFDASSGTCKRLGQPLFANHSPAVQQPAVKFYASSRFGEPRLALFSIKAGSGVSVRSLYSTVSTDCGSGGFLVLWPDSVPQVDSYRSCWIDRLTQLAQLAELMPRRQLIVELLASSGSRLLRIVFDASFGSGWFSKAAVVSSEPELGLKSRSYFHFSIPGFYAPASGISRNFYILTGQGGCSTDLGLLAVSDMRDLCGWANVANPPAIIYNQQFAYFARRRRFASYFVIYIA